MRPLKHSQLSEDKVVQRTYLFFWVVLGFLLSHGEVAQCQHPQSRFQAGGQYTYFHQQHGLFADNNMLGSRVDYRLIRHVWIDSQIDVGLKGYPPASSLSGGRLVVGSFGAKIGKEGHRVGLFGETRGGFLSWSQAIKSLDPFVSVQYGRLTRPLLYIGASCEIYGNRRIGFRISVGDAIVSYPKVTIVTGQPPFHGFTGNNVVMSSGAFYRF
jgi:hypothetical protein